MAVQEYGYIKGREEGREEVRNELIRTMIDNGIPISQIANMLKLKVSEIEDMLNEDGDTF